MSSDLFHQKFSTSVLKRSLEKYLKEITTKKCGEFLIQQYEIQFLLYHLIVTRMAKKNLCNIKWHEENESLLKKLQKETLGRLINSFTSLSKEEISLRADLEDYNQRRGQIVHQQELFIQFTNYEFNEIVTLQETEKTLNEALKKGRKLKILLLLLLFKDQNFINFLKELEKIKNILRSQIKK